MLCFIRNNAYIPGKSVVKIDMKGVFTFFEVQDHDVENVFQGFKAVDFNGRQVRIERSSGEDRSDRGGRSSRGGDRYGKSRSRDHKGGNDRGRSYNKDFRDFSGKRRESKSRY